MIRNSVMNSKNQFWVFLDLKKYDKLIEIIGYQGKVNSVIGILSSKKENKN